MGMAEQTVLALEHRLAQVLPAGAASQLDQLQLAVTAQCVAHRVARIALRLAGITEHECYLVSLADCVAKCLLGNPVRPDLRDRLRRHPIHFMQVVDYPRKQAHQKVVPVWALAVGSANRSFRPQKAEPPLDVRGQLVALG